MTKEVLEAYVRDLADRVRKSLEQENIASGLNVIVKMETRTHGDAGRYSVIVKDDNYPPTLAESLDPEVAANEFLRQKGWKETQHKLLIASTVKASEDAID